MTLIRETGGRMRAHWRRRLLVWALTAAALVALGLIACSEYAFLDDFPEYAPAEPFLEERAVQGKRVNALREEQERLRNRYLSESREAALREWRELEAKKQQGLERLRAEQVRRELAKKHRGPRNLDEWERIVR